MRRRWATIASFCVLSGSSVAQQFSMATVDLELVVAVDVSYSMDVEEQKVQRDGYVKAFRSPEVVRAVLGGPLGRTAVTYVEWGGTAVQVVPWTLIDGTQSAAQFSEELRRQPIRRISFTSISNALAFARKLIRTNGFRASRRVVDVSGDGPNNAGAPVPVARNAAIADGITVDGLPIMLKAAPDSASIPDLDRYYEACVIGGEGAFLLKVSDVSQLAEAIRDKLVIEIAGFKLSEIQKHPVARASVQHTQPFNCLVGEESQERSIGK